jgi:hypothetical protein
MKYQRSSKSAQTAFYSFPSTYLCNQSKAVEFYHNHLNIQKLNYCIQMGEKSCIPVRDEFHYYQYSRKYLRKLCLRIFTDKTKFLWNSKYSCSVV